MLARPSPLRSTGSPRKTKTPGSPSTPASQAATPITKPSAASAHSQKPIAPNRASPSAPPAQKTAAQRTGRLKGVVKSIALVGGSKASDRAESPCLVGVFQDGLRVSHPTHGAGMCAHMRACTYAFRYARRGVHGLALGMWHSPCMRVRHASQARYARRWHAKGSPTASSSTAARSMHTQQHRCSEKCQWCRCLRMACAFLIPRAAQACV